MPKCARIDVSIPVQILKEGRYFIAYCPVLDISTQAISFEKVQKRFDELVGIFLEEMVRQGKLEKYLREMGWKKHVKPKASWEPPFKVVSKEMHKVNIPCHV